MVETYNRGVSGLPAISYNPNMYSGGGQEFL